MMPGIEQLPVAFWDKSLRELTQVLGGHISEEQLDRVDQVLTQ